jgi:hypothetical protein
MVPPLCDARATLRRGPRLRIGLVRAAGESRNHNPSNAAPPACQGERRKRQFNRIAAAGNVKGRDFPRPPPLISMVLPTKFIPFFFQRHDKHWLWHVSCSEIADAGILQLSGQPLPGVSPPIELARITAREGEIREIYAFDAAFRRPSLPGHRASISQEDLICKGPGIERNDMSQPALSAPELDLFPSPTPPPRSATPVLVFPLCDEQETELPGTTARDGNCLKGLGFALGIEACAALCLYGTWQVLQTLR